MSNIGIDDLSTAAETTPNLTTLRVPLHDMGKAAVSRLNDRLSVHGRYGIRTVDARRGTLDQPETWSDMRRCESARIAT